VLIAAIGVHPHREEHGQTATAHRSPNRPGWHGTITCVTESAYYPFPREEYRIDPFDIAVAESQFIVLGGSRMSHAYRDPGPDAPGFGIEDLYVAIPMGYKILRYTQKIAVARDGEIAREWPRTIERDTSSVSAESDWLDRICGYLVFDHRSREVTVDPRHDHDAGVATVRAASLTGGPAVLLYIYRGRDWH
jgi:hypothetical protein